MDIELFHVSCAKYEPGTKLTVTERTPYSIRQKDLDHDWVDACLNKHKPEKAPLRDFTFYACDFIGNCHAFFKRTKCNNEIGKPFYYKVKMLNPVKAPMCLTDLILKSGKASEKIPKICNEYWSPQLDWQFYEYLSNEMEIVEVLNEPTQMQKMKGDANYMMDFDLGKTL